MLSYQLDYELFGMDPRAFHRTNILFHTGSAIILFLLLRSMTGSLWRSAFVAALFSIHPLRAESVAWISERKDVLSGFSFMLTLSAYTHCVRVATGKPKTVIRRYSLMLLLFATGLMCKPMLVTLPFVLLLLDFWPLNRFGTVSVKKLILEKTPLLFLSAAFCPISILMQKQITPDDQKVDFLWRLGNIAPAVITYIRQMIAPYGLTMYYPHPGEAIPLWKASASILLLTAISTAVIFNWKKRPYLTVGWCWYLGMLAPVSGIRQIGIHAYADRYTYLPQIGLGIALAWGTAELAARWRHRRTIPTTAALTVLTGLSATAWFQTSHWRDGETLWTHALTQTDDNRIANYNLASALAKNGKTDQAIEQYHRALRVWPQDPGALINLGCILAAKDDLETARDLFRRALEIKPDSPQALTDLGIVLAKQGKTEEAVHHYRQALNFDPDYLEAHINLGNALMKQKQLDAAIARYRRAIELSPNSAEAHYNMGAALLKAEKYKEALSAFQRAREINPESPVGQRSLNMEAMLRMSGE